MVFKILQIFLNCKPQRHWPDDQHCPVSSDTDPSASLRAHASCPCPNDVPWGLWGSANPVLVLTKFCTTYPLARIRAWTFQPLEQNFLNWQLQNCGVFLHWSFANAISSMFCMYDLINPWIIWLVILEFLRAWGTALWCLSACLPHCKTLGRWRRSCFHAGGTGSGPSTGRRWRSQQTRGVEGSSVSELVQAG